MTRRIVELVFHAVSTGMLALLFHLATLLHDRWMAIPMARGISVGISMEVVLVAHLMINLLISQLKHTGMKAVGLLAYAGVALYILFPFHPVRALFMLAIGLSVSVLAILAGKRVIERTPSWP